MFFFSLFDDNKTPTNSTENLSWNRNVHIAEDTSPMYDCDMMLLNDKKSTVMKSSSLKILTSNEGTPHINQKRILKGHNRFTNEHYFVTSKPKSLDIDQYLKVSPVVQNKRKQSSKSLLNRQISRESLDHNIEYSSLPHIANLKIQKTSQQIRKKTCSKTSGRNDNRLTLPPINIDQFRSVSAIPTENFKTLSALSVTSNFKEKLSKKKHSIGPLKNSISSRRERNIFLL